MYYCSKCKLAVIVLPNIQPIKACKCDAPIIAEMKAKVFNKSNLKQPNSCQMDLVDSKN